MVGFGNTACGAFIFASNMIRRDETRCRRTIGTPVDIQRIAPDIERFVCLQMLADALGDNRGFVLSLAHSPPLTVSGAPAGQSFISENCGSTVKAHQIDEQTKVEKTE